MSEDRIERAKKIYARFKDVFDAADKNDAPIVARALQAQEKRMEEEEKPLEGFCCHSLRIAVSEKVVLFAYPNGIKAMGKNFQITSGQKTYGIKKCPWCGEDLDQIIPNLKED